MVVRRTSRSRQGANWWGCGQGWWILFWLTWLSWKRRCVSFAYLHRRWVCLWVRIFFDSLHFGTPYICSQDSVSLWQGFVLYFPHARAMLRDQWFWTRVTPLCLCVLRHKSLTPNFYCLELFHLCVLPRWPPWSEGYLWWRSARHKPRGTAGGCIATVP